MIEFIRRQGLRMLACLVAVGGILTACKDNDDAYNAPTFTISPELTNGKLSVGADASSTTFTIETNRKWTAKSLAPSWLDVSPTSGEPGKVTITVKALANMGAARKGVIELLVGSAPQTITVEQAGASSPVEATFEGMPLADFLATYDKGADYIFTEEVTFQAVVLTDAPTNNTVSRRNITVQAGDKGLNIRLAKDGTFAPGALLTFKVRGAKLSRYNGSLQLDYTGVEGGVTDTGDTRIIEPKVVTFADIYAGKYADILVALDGVQFETEGGQLNATTDKTIYNTITDLQTSPTDAAMGKLSVAISRYAKFKETAKPSGNGRVVGILSYSETPTRKNYNIWPRTLEDLQLTGERRTAPADPNPVSPTPGATTTTLSAFIAQYGNAETTITEDVIFEASLLTDVQANNISGLKNLTVQSGDKGITIRLKADNTTFTRRNEVLRINAKGAKVTRYQGQLQIDFTAAAEQGISATGRTEVIQPKVVTLADVFAGSYESVLVTVSDVQIATVSGAYNALAKGTAYHLLTDCATQPTGDLVGLNLAVSGFAPFKATTMSDKRGAITGIINYSSQHKNYTIWPRDIADINLTQTRCTSGSSTPPPPPPAPTSGGELMFVGYAEPAGGNNKILQIYNPTANEVDLSGYSIQMENYGSKNTKVAGANPTLQLSGKIAAGAYFTIANSNATVTFPVDLKDTKVMGFNGNDNLALFKGTDMIDVIGTWGAAWLNGTASAGADKGLKRKASVKKPNVAFDASEWEEMPANDTSFFVR